MIKQKRILVTGADGFIGQHLCRSLLDAGNVVRGMRHGNHPLYFVNPDEVDWVDADLSKPDTVAGITKDIEIVFHLGAIPRNEKSKTWDDFNRVNVQGTETLLEDADKNKIKKFVFISTVEAAGFGDGVHPRQETDVPHPENNYGKSKLAAEKVVLHKERSFQKTVLRLPMVYGPGTFLIVPKLFGMVNKGIYPFIGNGSTKMEFGYVKNIVHAIILAADSDVADNELFFVSDDHSYSIKEVVAAIARSMNKKILSVHIPVGIAYIGALLFEGIAKIFPVSPLVSRVTKKPFFTRETVWWTTRNVNIVSTEKIRKLLGYKPPFSIDDGCRDTTAWLRSMKVL